MVSNGCHRQYKHPSKSGRITIAGHPADGLVPGTLNSIQAAVLQKILNFLPLYPGLFEDLQSVPGGRSRPCTGTTTRRFVSN
ncbi:type II toxin-antitoxin system HicA family toxin [Methanoculleus formosensis]|uniref:type II toxin-antitoxin system HicA family toxin n=1 Tax=Methanoculleus formosensis TaxID=2590886 RepID=UPI0021BF3171|nr:type II toxin-antitoxin system HicA family toxin [Methanoculleus sp. Afa-1]